MGKQVVEEMRQHLTEFKVGKDVEFETYKFMFGEEDCHYPGTLISGCKQLEKCVDLASAFIARRENGTSNLFVHMDADILHPAATCDVMEVVCWPEKDGTKSRIVNFEMYKIEEYDKEKDFFNMIEPVLCVKGRSTHVIGAWSHS